MDAVEEFWVYTIDNINRVNCNQLSIDIDAVASNPEVAVSESYEIWSVMTKIISGINEYVYVTLMTKTITCQDPDFTLQIFRTMNIGVIGQAFPRIDLILSTKSRNSKSIQTIKDLYDASFKYVPALSNIAVLKYFPDCIYHPDLVWNPPFDSNIEQISRIFFKVDVNETEDNTEKINLNIVCDGDYFDPLIKSREDEAKFIDAVLGLAQTLMGEYTLIYHLSGVNVTVMGDKHDLADPNLRPFIGNKENNFANVIFLMFQVQRCEICRISEKNTELIQYEYAIYRGSQISTLCPFCCYTFMN